MRSISVESAPLRRAEQVEKGQGIGGCERQREGKVVARVVSFIKKFFITHCERMCYSMEKDLPRLLLA